MHGAGFGEMSRPGWLKPVGLSVARDRGVDGAGPGVYAAGEGLSPVKALLAEPHGDVERTGAVVAENDDGFVRIKLVVSAAGDFSHGDEGAVLQVSGVELPGFADVEQARRIGLLAKLGELLRGDFGWKHASA